MIENLNKFLNLFTLYEYEALGRVEKVTSPNSSSTVQKVYADALGSVIHTTDALLRTSYSYANGLGETVKTKDALNATVSFTYNAYGQLLNTVTTAEGKTNTVSVEYDNWGRKVQTLDPIKGAWTYGYNAFGELINQSTPRNHTFKFFYDTLGRKIRSYEPNEGTLCWNYNSTGNEATYSVGKLRSTAKYAEENRDCETDNKGVLAGADIAKVFTFDSKGRAESVITTIGSESYQQSQSYDGYSRPLATT